MDQWINLKLIVNSVIYSVVGLFAYAVGFYLFDRLTPGQFWKEILEEHNTALAIVVGAMSVGIALIISSAIHS